MRSTYMQKQTRRMHVGAHMHTSANYPPPVSQMSPYVSAISKNNISADEGNASVLCLCFGRFVSTKTLNIHCLSSDLRWLPWQQIASHFKRRTKNSLAFPMHNEWPETALTQALSRSDLLRSVWPSQLSRRSGGAFPDRCSEPDSIPI